MRGQNKTGDSDWVGLDATLDRAPRLRIVGQVIPSPGVRVTGGVPATLNELPGARGQYLLFVNRSRRTASRSRQYRRILMRLRFPV